MEIKNKKKMPNNIKFIITVCIMILVMTIPFFLVVGYSVGLGRQFDNTYIAAMADKHNRLEDTDEPKIVLVGGSNLPFGIDSAMIEREIGMEVVNFGLYAALGTKTNMDLSKANINECDIVILVPELNQQTYSTYIDGEIMLQALDSKRNMIWDIPANDWLVMANSYPEYLKDKKEFSSTEKPDPDNVYARSSFNEYGDIDYPRPYNVMADMYDSSSMINIDKNIISSGFVEYVNDYVSYAERRDAKVFLSFPPVNESAIAEECTPEGRLEFYDHARQSFDAEVISNVEDYIMHEDYFYDSNYHLNDSGVVARTAMLIGDIKRELRITTPTDISIPDGSGAEPSDDDTEGSEADNELALDFVMELINDKYVVEGLSAQGKSKKSVRIPATFNSKPVYKIAHSAFANEKVIEQLTIPESVEVLENELFNGASKLVKVILNVDKASDALFPEVNMNGLLLTGASDNLKIYVPKNKLNDITIDYFWAAYSSRIVSQ